MNTLEEILEFGNLSIDTLIISNEHQLKELGFKSNGDIDIHYKKINNIFEPIVIKKDVDTFVNDIFLVFRNIKNIIEVSKFIHRINEYFGGEKLSKENIRKSIENEVEKNYNYMNEKYNLGIHISFFDKLEIRISMNENY